MQSTEVILQVLHIAWLKECLPVTYKGCLDQARIRRGIFVIVYFKMHQLTASEEDIAKREKAKVQDQQKITKRRVIKMEGGHWEDDIVLRE